MAKELQTQGEMQKSISQFIDMMKPQMELALPKHLTADRLARIALSEVRTTPKLGQCSRVSLAASIMQTAQLGLEPGKHLGLAYLVPYKDECTLIIGYKGLIALVRRSGELKTIFAKTVHEGDKFEQTLGLHPDLIHVPDDNTDKTWENMTHAYAVAHLNNGGEQFEVMSKKEIEVIKNRSAAARSGPWITDALEMAKKTVLKRICKVLPVSVEAQSAMALDDEADRGVKQTFNMMPQIEHDIDGEIVDDPFEGGDDAEA